MSYYTEYLNKNMNYDAIRKERKVQLKKISQLRGNRDILVYASDLMKGIAPISIDYSDILAISDQLSQMNGTEIDIILETPGGIAEVVEDAVKLIRGKYEKVGVIIAGWAKSAGTIFAMAGDEILMGKTSALGPIDAQIFNNNKRFSAEAFLEGLEKIKEEVVKTQKLNPAYIPILQNISPGEIQHCKNAQDFSKILVIKWLMDYKFKYWEKHSSTGNPVTSEEKEKQADKIAGILCKQSEWLTHGRSIKIDDFNRIGLKITDFSSNVELNEAIQRYYTLLRMSFESTNMYKLFETKETQIERYLVQQIIQGKSPSPDQIEKAEANYKCNNCGHVLKIQFNFKPNTPLNAGNLPYPIKDDILVCPNCKSEHIIKPMKLSLEAQLGKKVI